ncbi:hypothetical protein BsWGS_22526 [Bradybaena similaris]
MPCQKSGYMFIKQHSQVRPRKLKTWKRRWIVLTKLSNLSSDEYVAKLDLYDNETKWQSNSPDKKTFILENVTGIQQTSSSTHQYAFEVVEKQPVLVLSGSSLEETCGWMLTLQQIFTPGEVLASKGDYKVAVVADAHSSWWNLSGEFIMSISPACIGLNDLQGRSEVTWPLNTLKRFQLEKCPTTGLKSVLVIECGPNSPTGQGCLRFQSDDSRKMMCSIKQSVCIAAALKQQTEDIVHTRSRQLDSTRGERGILPENQITLHSFLPNRSDSESSVSTTNQKSTAVRQNVSFYSVPSAASSLYEEEKLQAKTVQKVHVCGAYYNCKDDCTCEVFKTCEDGVLGQTIGSSENTKNCKEIKSTAIEQGPETDNHPLACASPKINLRKLRSVSTVVAAIRATSGQDASRFESPDNDKPADKDSAISSMISTPNDDLAWMDMQECRGFDLNENLSSNKHNFLTHQQQHTTQDTFENEYEELCELSAALQSIHKEQEPETPPELPARFPPIGCTSCNALTKCTCGNARSLFKPTEKCNSDKTNINTRTSSHLANVNEEMGAASRHAICDVCGSDKFNRTAKCLTKAFSNEDLTLNCSYVNGTIAPTQDAESTRRYSSNVTPGKRSCRFVKFTTDTVSNTNLMQERELQASGEPKPQLHNFSNRTGSGTFETATKPIHLSSYANINLTNPPAIFFLENDNFDNNPIVAEEQTPVTPSLYNNSEILYSTPRSVSILANHTPPSSSLKTESMPNLKDYQYDNGFGAFNLWADGQINKEQNVALSQISFACVQHIFNQNGKDCMSLPSNVAQQNQNDYIAMVVKSDSWCSKTVTDTKSMRTTRLAGGWANLAFLGSQAQDIYVQPNNIPIDVERCRQRNVY